ncbi:MAG TPA: DnaJ C-terminal domain-containing protein [Armatimonadota bacterium]|nr:DnaJ C-terminal domain-containing protein [Armatimonadota bacterium]
MAAGGSRDYYEILNISRDADEKAIKSAFRRLARKYHPDVNPGDSSAEQKFKEISEAYEVLRDPKKRSQYDRFGHLGDAWRRAAAGAPGGWAGRTTVGPDFDFSGFGGGLDDILGDLVGGRGGVFTRARARRGQDVRAEIELTLEDAFGGVTREIALPIPQVCPTCRGEGVIGRGSVCAACGGGGQVEQLKRLEVKIPAGVRTGSKIRVAGQGVPSPGGQRGDLYLIPRIAPHRLFKRQGDDLHIEVPVTYSEAALGAQIEVPTLNGRVKMKLPPGASPGQRLRLAGRGMPRMRGGGKGDLYVRVRVVVPKDLSEEERDLIGRLGEMRKGNPRANLRA